MLPQSSDTFTKSSDILNTLGVKGARPIRNSPTYVQPKSLISAEAKKLKRDVLNYLDEFIAYFHNMIGFVTRPPFCTKIVAK